ncbi:hypothetical protein SCA6_003568 [Theobroma cacao]
MNKQSANSMTISSSLVKFATGILVLLLFLGDHQAISASLPSGEDKSLLHVPRCGSRKTFPGEDGSLDCQSLVFSSRRKLSFRSLRSTSTLSPPPSPTIGKAKAMAVPAPPPPAL